VSKIEAVQRPDGTVFTITSWAQDVTTLLPAADIISLSEWTDESVRKGTYAWDDVARVVGDTCWRVRDDLRPPRILAFAWPSPEIYAQLRAYAISESESPNPLRDPPATLSSAP
jgi:hypothetical protein